MRPAIFAAFPGEGHGRSSERRWLLGLRLRGQALLKAAAVSQKRAPALHREHRKPGLAGPGPDAPQDSAMTAHA